MKLKLIKLFIIIIIVFLSSCVLDWQANIAIIKNNTSSRLVVAKQPNQIMTDSILYNMRFSKSWIDVSKFQTLSIPNTVLSSKSDSDKAYLYVFNCDSVNKYQTLKKMGGILQHSFIKKIEIQLNKVKLPLDTIYVK